MAKKLYVGNLSYGTTDSDLQGMFEEYGTVESAQVIIDRDSGRSKGFGFVEMRNDQEAQAAINASERQRGRRSVVDRERSQAARRPRWGQVGRWRWWWPRRTWRRRLRWWRWRRRRLRWRRRWRRWPSLLNTRLVQGDSPFPSWDHPRKKPRLVYGHSDRPEPRGSNVDCGVVFIGLVTPNLFGV